MELSKRLQAIADMVTPGNIVADIGCDHGYVSIYLVEQKIAPKVIAMDVNIGPLTKAKEHIEKYGYLEYIETRLSDGVNKLKAGEADALICAGMGGKLTLRILENDAQTIRQMKECILQPQSDIALVRNTLLEWGYVIEDENMIFEDGKFYPMMRIRFHRDEAAGDRPKLTKAQAKYGPVLLQNRNITLFQFLTKEKEKTEKILLALKESEVKNERKTKRIQELEEEREILSKAFSYFCKNN